ncbi:hypothetical protein D3C85_1041970 [compost metagenome]
MRAVGVDAGLEPGPGVHQLDVGEGAGDLAHHRLGGVQGHFVFRHLILQGFDHCGTADVGDTRAVADHGMLLDRLDQAHAHAGRGDIQQLRIRVAGGELVTVLQVQMVELDADAPRLGQGLLDGDEEVVTLPVGVDDVVGADGTAPWLAAIDIGADGYSAVLSHHQGVGATERAEQEIAVVVDVVVRGEDRRVYVFGGHVATQAGLAVGIFLGGESRLDLLAVLNSECLGHLHGVDPCCFPVTRPTGLVSRWKALQQIQTADFCTFPTPSWSDPLHLPRHIPKRCKPLEKRQAMDARNAALQGSRPDTKKPRPARTVTGRCGKKRNGCH